MAIKVIGVCGAIGAGKGEVSKRLAEALDLPEYAFAQPIKELAHSGKHELTPCRANKETPQTVELFYGDIFKIVSKYLGTNGHDFCIAATNRLFDVLAANLGSVPGQPGRSVRFRTSWRQLYQFIGTDWGRNTIDQQIWLKLRPKTCIVNDVRAFEGAVEPDAESLSIIEDGGVIVRVTSTRSDVVDNSNGHSSEFPVSDKLTQFEVTNDGTLEDLDDVVDKLAEAILEITDAPAALDAKNNPTPAKKTTKRKARKNVEADGTEDTDS